MAAKKATRWLPIVACFIDDEEDASPPVVSHVVDRTGCCCGGCIGFMFFMLFLAGAAISGQEEDFPTTDSTGFRDRNDITSLSLDAVDLVLQQKDVAEKSLRADMICEEDRSGKEQCEVDAVVPPNTKANRRWGLTLMFKRKDNKNLLTPDILTKIKTNVVDKVTGAKDYDKYCLKNPPACTHISCSPRAGGTANQTTCSQYSLVPAGQWRSRCLGLGCDYTAAGANTTASASAASCNATGAVWTPSACSPIMSPLNWIYPTAEVSGNTINAVRFDGQGTEISPCQAATGLGINRTSTCNSMSCPCDATAAAATPISRLASGLEVMAHTSWSLYMVGKEFTSTNLQTDVMRFTLNFGGPLCKDGVCYKNPETEKDAQNEMFETWAIDTLKDMLDSSDFDDVEVLYFFPVITFQEILNVLMHDGLLALGSVVFVFGYIWFHSSSAFLAGAGMLHIMLSFPLAFVIYRFVFGIIPVYTLSFLSIYIILAIGADDVFVFVDAWRQSARAGPEVNKDIHTRMTYAYKRSAKAMAITSCTTFGAFVATATSPLGEVATFGLFTALLVLANYIFVITFYPAVVLIYHRKYEHTTGCCCTNRLIPPTPERGEMAGAVTPSVPISPTESDDGSGLRDPPPLPPAKAAALPPDVRAGDFRHPDAIVAHEKGGVVDVKVAGEAVDAAQDPAPQTRIEVFCTAKFAPFANSKAKYVMVTVLTIVAFILMIKATELGPTTAEDQLLPDWHKFQRIINMFNNDFQQGEDTPMKLNNIVWGLDATAPVNRDGIGRFDVGTAALGKLNWDRSFSLANSQAYILSICNQVLNAVETIEGKPQRLVRSAGLGDREVNCFMAGFKAWVEDPTQRASPNLTFPVAPTAFPGLLATWLEARLNASTAEYNPRRWAPHEDYEDMVWLSPHGDFAMIQVNTTLGRWDAAYDPLKVAYDAWEQWMIKTNAAAPPSAGKAFFSSPENQADGAWVFMDTQEMLVGGAVFGLFASGIVAFVVLSISTFNPFIALLSMVNILGVLLCILGMMAVNGWEMGVIESISITILVGLSVDYVVHLANSYIEADAADRQDRVAASFEEMGVTVFGGACTSIGASAMLFLCYFQMFFKFGGFMFMTIVTSFIWANCFFMPVLSIMGPQGDEDSLFCSFKPWFTRVTANVGKGKRNQIEPEPQLGP